MTIVWPSVGRIEAKISEGMKMEKGTVVCGLGMGRHMC